MNGCVGFLLLAVLLGVHRPRWLDLGNVHRRHDFKVKISLQGFEIGPFPPRDAQAVREEHETAHRYDLEQGAMKHGEELLKVETLREDDQVVVGRDALS